MKPSRIHRVSDHIPDRLRSPDLVRIRIFLVQIVGCPKRSVSLIDDQIKDFSDNRPFHLVDLQIIELTVFLADPAIQHELVAIGSNAAAPQPV